jgi:hypothetical protein
MKNDNLLLGLFVGVLGGMICGALMMKVIYADSIDRWNEVNYKYSYCPYCGEELGIRFDDK